MISRSNTVNLSNMPAISEEVYKSGSNPADDSLASRLSTLSIGELTDEWKITRFETTPPACLGFPDDRPISDTYFQMSSYIVAFANGPFKYLESSYVSPLSGKTRPLRIYGRTSLFFHTYFHKLTRLHSYFGLYSPGSILPWRQGKMFAAVREGLRCRIPSSKARHSCCKWTRLHVNDVD